MLQLVVFERTLNKPARCEYSERPGSAAKDEIILNYTSYFMGLSFGQSEERTGMIIESVAGSIR